MQITRESVYILRKDSTPTRLAWNMYQHGHRFIVFFLFLFLARTIIASVRRHVKTLNTFNNADHGQNKVT